MKQRVSRIIRKHVTALEKELHTLITDDDDHSSSSSSGDAPPSPVPKKRFGRGTVSAAYRPSLSDDDDDEGESVEPINDPLAVDSFREFNRLYRQRGAEVAMRMPWFRKRYGDVLDMIRSGVKNTDVYDATIKPCLDPDAREPPKVVCTPGHATTTCIMCGKRKDCSEQLVIGTESHRIASHCARLARAVIEFYTQLATHASKSRSTIDQATIDQLDQCLKRVTEGHEGKRRRHF